MNLNRITRGALLALVTSAWCAATVVGPAQAQSAASVLTQPSERAKSAARKGPSEAETREYFTDLEVVDQNGNPLKFYSDVLKDRTVLINFIYTTCADACPIQTAKLVQVRNAIEDRFGKDIYFVSLSVDPVNDTPEKLKAFAVEQKADGPGWRFLTGKPENLHHIVKKLGQFTEDPTMHATGMLVGNVKTRHWVMVNPIIPFTALSFQLEQFANEG